MSEAGIGLHQVSSPEDVHKEAIHTLRDRNVPIANKNVSINSYNET